MSRLDIGETIQVILQCCLFGLNLSGNMLESSEKSHIILIFSVSAEVQNMPERIAVVYILSNHLAHCQHKLRISSKCCMQ